MLSCAMHSEKTFWKDKPKAHIDITSLENENWEEHNDDHVPLVM